MLIFRHLVITLATIAAASRLDAAVGDWSIVNWTCTTTTGSSATPAFIRGNAADVSAARHSIHFTITPSQPDSGADFDLWDIDLGIVRGTRGEQDVIENFADDLSSSVGAPIPGKTIRGIESDAPNPADAPADPGTLTLASVSVEGAAAASDASLISDSVIQRIALYGILLTPQRDVFLAVGILVAGGLALSFGLLGRWRRRGRRSSRRSNRRVALRVAVSGVCTLGLATLLAWPALRDWQCRRSLAGAEHFLKAGRPSEANLLARQALTLGPEDPATLRTMLRLARDAEMLVWQRRLCDALPGDTAELLTLARLALRFRETMVADAALARIPAAARQTAAWHELMAGVAIQQGRAEAAAEHLSEALALDPANRTLELNLAAARLLSADVAVAAAARAETERLAALPECRLIALRNLLADARRQASAERARAFAEQLSQLPEATAADRLSRLEELRKLDEPRFRAALEILRRDAAGSPPVLASLIEWMNASGLADESLRWLEHIPASLRTERPIALAAAETYSRTKQWEALKHHIGGHDWGSVDFLRPAFRARAEARDRPNPKGAPVIAAWSQAVAATRGDTNALTILACLAESWDWPEQAAQPWWVLARLPAGQRPALAALFRHYHTAGDAEGLYDVTLRTLEIEPLDPIAKNNRASLALILGRDSPEAHRLAAELYAAHPARADIVSTRAFSLLLQDEATDAARLIDTLPREARDEPSVAFYRAVILAERGRLDEAYPVLKAAQTGAGFLTAERALASHILGGK